MNALRAARAAVTLFAGMPKLAAGLVVLAGVAQAADQPIPGAKLVMRASDSGSETLTFVSRSGALVAPLGGGPDDPTLVGATLEVRGASGGRALLEMPALGWTSVAGGTAFKFNNRLAPSAFSAVKLSRVRDAKGLKIIARSTGISLDAASQGGVALGLTVGSQRYCATFGGEVIRDRRGIFVAHNAPAPVSCPCEDGDPLCDPCQSAVPPDPATVAPPIDPTVVTDLATAAAYLYTLPVPWAGVGGCMQPIQPHVTATGSIDRLRAAVLRGRVLDAGGRALPGVRIGILGQPEFGETVSRVDGRFDLVVNGGGRLTVMYSRADHLHAQRQVEVPAQDYLTLADVVLVRPDAAVTSISLPSTGMQVARGTAVTDSAGTRRATLLFPDGTAATMTLPDGSAQPLGTLHVRLTEYTQGVLGPQRMPGSLPPASAYTYAVEFSVDEAEARGATQVQFSQPVAFHVENFLDFDVGTDVPYGSYDRTEGMWAPAPSGRVIKILGTSGGIAALDVDGSDTAASASALYALGITDLERQTLASLYTAGQEVWRTPVTHFTPGDCNWPYGPPSDATPPNQPPPDGDDFDEDDCESSGSIIECGNQVLRETIPLAGMPFTLNYSSARGPARGRTLVIHATGAAVPTSLKRVALDIRIAGRQWTDTLSAAPSQDYVFTWDGRDTTGRALQGRQTAVVRIGWVYDGVYGSGASRFADFGVTPTFNLTRQELTFWQEHKSRLGNWAGPGSGFGGWSLDVHHVYEPASGTLYLGGGRRLSPPDDAFQWFLSTRLTEIKTPEVLDAAPDRSIYFTVLHLFNFFGDRVLRVTPAGSVTTVAGTGFYGYSGDGGPATQALIQPVDIAVAADGGVYIAQPCTIRQVGTDGIIDRFAGTVPPCGSVDSGDGGPALQAALAGVTSVAVGPDHSVYVMTFRRVRKIAPDGIITTIVGNGQSAATCTNCPASQARLGEDGRLTVGPDGTLYIVDRLRHRVHRVTPDGIFTTIAGTGTRGLSGDGGAATAAQLNYPAEAAVDRTGAVYIMDAGNYVVRRVAPDGTIATIAGIPGTSSGTTGAGDGGPATGAPLRNPSSITIDPDGRLHVMEPDTFHGRIRTLHSNNPWLSQGEIAVASKDGSEVYVFSALGKHLRTLDARTNGVKYTFDYDPAGWLTGITDAANLHTTVGRNGGIATSLTSPAGKVTTFTSDGDGYLAQVSTGGLSYAMTYYAGGLLHTFRNARGLEHTYAYTADDRLHVDQDPAGGFKQLDRTVSAEGSSVALTTAEGRVTVYAKTSPNQGDVLRTVTLPSGLANEALREINGRTTTLFPDGTTITRVLGPDPRFGMQAPMLQSLTATTPGGLVFQRSASRAVSLSDPANPLTLVSETQTDEVNGRTYTRTYAAATRTYTHSSPEGRVATRVLDAQGRLTRVQFANLTPLDITYDGRGRLFTYGRGTRTFTIGYDSSDRVATVTGPEGFFHQLQSYDLADRFHTAILPGGRSVQLDYDGNTNVTSVTPPGRPAHGQSFGLVDLLSGYQPPVVAGSGTTNTAFTYNRDRQLTQIDRPDGGRVVLGYEPGTGRLASLTSSVGTTTGITFGYHPTTGQPQRVVFDAAGTSDDVTLTLAHDGRLPTLTTWAGAVSGSVGRSYDNGLRIASISVNGAVLASFQYDNDGVLVGAGPVAFTPDPATGLLVGAMLGAVSESYGYNSFGELASSQASYAGIPQYALTIDPTDRDGLGRIRRKTETVLGTTTTSDYTYDAAGRLWTVRTNGGAPATYTYDANGNRLTAPGLTGTPVYDGQDRLLTYGNTSYTCTANGELASKSVSGQVSTYVYDALGNLRTVTVPGTTIAYTVDGAGRRVAKRRNGAVVAKWLYDGPRPIAELAANNGVVSRFVYGTRPTVPEYMLRGGATYRLVTDHLGSPRLVIDVSTGTVAQRLDYDEFGRVTLDTNPGFQPFGFAGGLYDGDTGLVRFGARDYDPQTGRWTAKDPILFGSRDFNLYGYTFNDPVNLLDPLGLRPLTGCEKTRLSPYIPKTDLERTDLHDDRVPWYTPSNAIGITRGNDIYFRPEIYDPSTVAGLSLLGHELTHVGQYRAGATWLDFIWSYRNGYDSSPYEQSASTVQEIIRNELVDSGYDECPCGR
jgi:RHS repeat-associated protein